jgi:hypothetical protein
MTETGLKTAEDIVEDLEESGFSPMTWGVGKDSPAAHEWRAWMLTTVRDIQRNAELHYLEAAAKHLRHQADCADAIDDPSDAALWRLAAMCILELIPKDPAPTIKRRPGDMTIVRRRAPTNDGTYVRAENPESVGEVKP